MNLAQALCNNVVSKSRFSHPCYVLLFIMIVGDSSSFSLTPSEKIKKNWLGCVRSQLGPPRAAEVTPVSSLAHWQGMEQDSAILPPVHKGPYGGGAVCGSCCLRPLPWPTQHDGGRSATWRSVMGQ